MLLSAAEVCHYVLDIGDLKMSPKMSAWRSAIYSCFTCSYVAISNQAAEKNVQANVHLSINVVAMEFQKSG